MKSVLQQLSPQYLQSPKKIFYLNIEDVETQIPITYHGADYLQRRSLGMLSCQAAGQVDNGLSEKITVKGRKIIKTVFPDEH